MSFNNKNYTFTQILIIKFIFFIIIFFLIIGAITTTIKSKNFPTKKIILKTTTTEPTLNLTSQTKPITWMKVYGSKDRDWGGVILPTVDNGYIVIGGGFVFRLDSLGNIQWSKTYKDLYYYLGINYISSTPDGAYIVGGFHSQPEDADALIFKLDSSGNIQWQTLFEITDYYGKFSKYAHTQHVSFFKQYITSMVLAPDGSYVVAGYTSILGDTDALVSKLDSSGNVQWVKTYGGKYHSTADSILPTSDGGYMVVGSKDYNILIFKLDSSGDVQWAKTYSGGREDYVSAVVKTPDDNYVAVGGTYLSENFSDILIFKLDSSGNIQWAKTYGGRKNDGAGAIVLAPDGGYVIAGSTQNYGWPHAEWRYDALILKVDSSGNLQWAKKYGGVNDDYVNFIYPTPDKGYIVSGVTRSYGAGSEDLLILKLDSAGNINNCSIVQSVTSSSSSLTLSSSNIVVLVNTPLFSSRASSPSMLSSLSSPIFSQQLCPQRSFSP